MMGSRALLLRLFVLVVGMVCLSGDVQAGDAAPLSEATQECIDCHESVTPGIVADWRTSRHARTRPADALRKPVLERRISSDTLPADLSTVAVGCYECHSRNPAVHADNFEHFGFAINVVVSPNDCAVCHPVETEQFAGTKKAHAVDILRKNPLYNTLVETITSPKTLDDGVLRQLPPSHMNQHETCYGCHGTEVRVEGMKTVSSEFDDIEVPNLTNWPNQGVGRINPDGSFGACTACHPRHSFSIEVARKPYTCMQCHLEPDVPAWDVYRESKHGNIFLSLGNEWNWDQVPWRPGVDFTAPTCATCHNSLLVSADGDVVAPRTHDFGSRLWVRLFGLIYSHPQPRSGKTYEIRNADGLPLPVTFAGVPAAGYLIDADEQAARRETMAAVCRSCHSTSWTSGHFAKMDSTLKATDEMVRAATDLMTRAWELGLADKTNPFDEKIEAMWVKQWLFYANSVRYASAMSGPDYATFKNGWWYLTANLRAMHEHIREHAEDDD